MIVSLRLRCDSCGKELLSETSVPPGWRVRINEAGQELHYCGPICAEEPSE